MFICYCIFQLFSIYCVQVGRMNQKRTMTLNLTEAEMQVLGELAKKKDLTKTAVVRQAIRFYQMVDARLSLGEKLVFEDEKAQKKAELIVL